MEVDHQVVLVGDHPVVLEVVQQDLGLLVERFLLEVEASPELTC